MNQPSAVELRIFSGIHAGARAALAPGRLLLGADPDCDLILCDPGVAPRHAELRSDDSGWRLFPLVAGAGLPVDGVRLAPGVGLSIGPVLVALAALDAPWQLPEATFAEEAALPAAPGTPAVAPLPPTPAPQAGGAGRPSRTNRTSCPRRLPLGLLASGAAVFAVLLAVVLALTPADEAPLPAAPPVDALAQALAVVQRLEMTAQVQAERMADGRVLVSATLLDESGYETLAQALAQLNPRPALRVTGEQQLIESVNDAVRARGGDLSVDYLGAGRFRLGGRVGSDAEGEALLRALAAGLPAVRGFENALLSTDRLAAQLLDELREHGASSLHGQWQDDVFMVDARVALHVRLPWEQALLRIDARHGRSIRFAVRTEWRAAAGDDLPFRIQSVVGGATPYLVLADGRKILPGGRVDGWRLLEIDGLQVVFDEPRRVLLRR